MALSNVTGRAQNQRRPAEANPYVRLAHAILLAAYKDVASTNSHQANAVWFFESGTYIRWALAGGIDPDLAYEGYQNVLKNGIPPTDGRRHGPTTKREY